MKHQHVLALSLMISACGLDTRDTNSFASVGFGTDSADDGGIGATSEIDPSNETLDGSGAGADDGARFDVGPGGSPDPETSSCKKVDVVLAVDNSSSMSQEHDALHGPVFDSFPQALLNVGNGLEDFRLAVIDACNDPPAFHNWGDQGDCEFSTGLNYMVSTSPRLEQEYRCVTEFPGGSPVFPPVPDTNSHGGYEGMPDHCTGSSDDEQPANTASLALSAEALGEFNSDFLREDAVLFVVAITDEDETPIPAASAQEIADRLVAAKGSINNVVMLGIGGIGVPGQDDDDGEEEEDHECDGPYGSAKDATLLREVTAIFEAESRGLFWDLCQGDLEQAFAAAIELIDGACIDFDPVG